MGQIISEIGKYFDMNENKNSTCQNPKEKAKQCPGGKL